MATLKMPWNGGFGWVKKPGPVDDSRRAREFVRRVYKETGGPTPELKRVFESFRDNERRRTAHREAQG